MIGLEEDRRLREGTCGTTVIADSRGCIVQTEPHMPGIVRMAADHQLDHPQHSLVQLDRTARMLAGRRFRLWFRVVGRKHGGPSIARVTGLHRTSKLGAVRGRPRWA